ncbi:hypothetical protein TRIUR3_20293 [Triticum urartu]|uniref:Uncharacterized protein n=1 Tax=Triticum urartu TaxID=4572 RepID=M8AKC8_TRIUA|nr:hypothetical protein TRIUR3_20293 [Triticum urartu]
MGVVGATDMQFKGRATVPVIASRVGPPLFPYVDAGQCAPGFYRSRGDQEGTL